MARSVNHRNHSRISLRGHGGYHDDEYDPYEGARYDDRSRWEDGYETTSQRRRRERRERETSSERRERKARKRERRDEEEYQKQFRVRDRWEVAQHMNPHETSSQRRERKARKRERREREAREHEEQEQLRHGERERKERERLERERESSRERRERKARKRERERRRREEEEDYERERHGSRVHGSRRPGMYSPEPRRNREREDRRGREYDDRHEHREDRYERDDHRGREDRYGRAYYDDRHDEPYEREDRYRDRREDDRHEDDRYEDDRRRYNSVGCDESITERGRQYMIDKYLYEQPVADKENLCKEDIPDMMDDDLDPVYPGNKYFKKNIATPSKPSVYDGSDESQWDTDNMMCISEVSTPRADQDEIDYLVANRGDTWKRLSKRRLERLDGQDQICFHAERAMRQERPIEDEPSASAVQRHGSGWGAPVQEPTPPSPRQDVVPTEEPTVGSAAAAPRRTVPLPIKSAEWAAYHEKHERRQERWESEQREIAERKERAAEEQRKNDAAPILINGWGEHSLAQQQAQEKKRQQEQQRKEEVIPPGWSTDAWPKKPSVEENPVAVDGWGQELIKPPTKEHTTRAGIPAPKKSPTASPSASLKGSPVASWGIPAPKKAAGPALAESSGWGDATSKPIAAGWGAVPPPPPQPRPPPREQPARNTGWADDQTKPEPTPVQNYGWGEPEAKRPEQPAQASSWGAQPEKKPEPSKQGDGWGSGWNNSWGNSWDDKNKNQASSSTAPPRPAAAPKAVAPPVRSVGRGRGTALTMPAWKVKAEQEARLQAERGTAEQPAAAPTKASDQPTTWGSRLPEVLKNRQPAAASNGWGNHATTSKADQRGGWGNSNRDSWYNSGWNNESKGGAYREQKPVEAPKEEAQKKYEAYAARSPAPPLPSAVPRRPPPAQPSAASAAPSSAPPPAPAKPVMGRGRGSILTQPAWMTRHKDQPPELPKNGMPKAEMQKAELPKVPSDSLDDTEESTPNANLDSTPNVSPPQPVYDDDAHSLDPPTPLCKIAKNPFPDVSRIIGNGEIETPEKRTGGYDPTPEKINPRPYYTKDPPAVEKKESPTQYFNMATPPESPEPHTASTNGIAPPPAASSTMPHEDIPEGLPMDSVLFTDLWNPDEAPVSKKKPKKIQGKPQDDGWWLPWPEESRLKCEKHPPLEAFPQSIAAKIDMTTIPLRWDRHINNKYGALTTKTVNLSQGVYIRTIFEAKAKSYKYALVAQNKKEAKAILKLRLLEKFARDWGKSEIVNGLPVLVPHPCVTDDGGDDGDNILTQISKDGGSMEVFREIAHLQANKGMKVAVQRAIDRFKHNPKCIQPKFYRHFFPQLLEQIVILGSKGYDSLGEFEKLLKLVVVDVDTHNALLAVAEIRPQDQICNPLLTHKDHADRINSPRPGEHCPCLERLELLDAKWFGSAERRNFYVKQRLYMAKERRAAVDGALGEPKYECKSFSVELVKSNGVVLLRSTEGHWSVDQALIPYVCSDNTDQIPEYQENDWLILSDANEDWRSRKRYVLRVISAKIPDGRREIYGQILGDTTREAVDYLQQRKSCFLEGGEGNIPFDRCVTALRRSLAINEFVDDEGQLVAGEFRDPSKPEKKLVTYCDEFVQSLLSVEQKIIFQL